MSSLSDDGRSAQSSICQMDVTIEQESLSTACPAEVAKDDSLDLICSEMLAEESQQLFPEIQRFMREIHSSEEYKRFAEEMPWRAPFTQSDLEMVRELAALTPVLLSEKMDEVHCLIQDLSTIEQKELRRLDSLNSKLEFLRTQNMTY